MCSEQRHRRLQMSLVRLIFNIIILSTTMSTYNLFDDVDLEEFALSWEEEMVAPADIVRIEHSLTNNCF